MTSSDNTPPSEVEIDSRAPVSFASEELILVDGQDRVLGHTNKLAAHSGRGTLHRAFSVFLFDDSGRVLVHQRSAKKPLWPGYWTNSCCSHPRRGETLESAVRRRVLEELGVRAEIQRVYQFEYHAAFEDRGSEHELCHVFLAHVAGVPRISAHSDEVSDWKWLLPEIVDRQMRAARDDLTPWFRLEWQALRGEYRQVLQAFIATLPAAQAPDRAPADGHSQKEQGAA